jgi:hypothetical protein
MSSNDEGRIKVEPDLSTPGHPEIFVIGDTATIDGWHGKPVPGIAPAAKQQGRHVATTIKIRLRGDASPRPFRYKHSGSLATIGKRSAVIDFGWIRIRGWIAWWIWGLAPYLLPDRRAQSPSRRVELAVDLRHWRSQRPSDHAGRSATEATLGQPVQRIGVFAADERSLSFAVERLGSGDSIARLPQQGQSSFTYVLDGKAIFTHHDVAGTRRAEAVYAQHVTAIAGVAMPALRCTRLDGKSRVDRRQ